MNLHTIRPLPPGRPKVINRDLRWHLIAVRPGTHADKQIDRLLGAIGVPDLGCEERTVVRAPDLVAALGAIAWVRAKLVHLLTELLVLKSANKNAWDDAPGGSDKE